VATRLYGDSLSGNCLKVKWVLDRLKTPYQWEEVLVPQGGAKTKEFLAINPAGQVPAAVLADGRTLSQSGALLLHFAAGSDLIPQDPYERARMHQWMFWEQYSHEPYTAVRRYLIAFLGKRPEELDPKLFDRGSAALALMEAELGRKAWFAGDRLSLADVALVAYTRMAGDGGFDLGLYPKVRAWIARVEAELGLEAYTGIEAQPTVA
jgi:glutathione S-transferase